jgi:hypothetical protein
MEYQVKPLSLHVHGQPQIYTISVYLWLNNPVKNIINQSAIKSRLKPVKATGPAITRISRLLADSGLNGEATPKYNGAK